MTEAAAFKIYLKHMIFLPRFNHMRMILKNIYTTGTYTSSVS